MPSTALTPAVRQPDALKRHAEIQSRRVCILTSSDTWGGAELHTLALTEALAARGHDCIIVELNQPVISARRTLVAPGVNVRAVQLGSVPGQSSFVGTYRFLRQIGADVGVLAKSWSGVGSLSLELACRLALRGRFLTIEHGMPPPRRRKTTSKHLGGRVPGLGLYWYSAGLKVYVRSIFPKRIVTVSRAVMEDLVNGYWFPSRKMVPIPNGIDPDRFVPDAETRTRTRAAWGVPDDAVVFGSMGRLSIPDKAIDVSIDLFARLCEEWPERSLRYVLVGDGRHEARLRAQAAATGWGSRILFAGPTDRPRETLCGMDVLLLPSRHEGIGFVLLEAMACGCCPVAMGVGGVRDVLTDPALGWLIPPGDRESFLRAMKAALALGPDGRAAMGRTARAHIVRNFRSAEQYGKLVDVIERM